MSGNESLQPAVLSDVTLGVNIMSSISEASKNSRRWQELSAVMTEAVEEQKFGDEAPNRPWLSSETTRPPSNNSVPLYLTPSHLYIQYEQTIDTAMQEVRSLKSSLRDEHWEDHNADQLVSSLFALSRSCIESAELFVTRQEQSSGVHKLPKGAASFADLENSNSDPYQTQLPTLQQVVTQFQEAKRIHEDMKDDVTQRQRDIKYKYGIYLTPILNTFHQKQDNEAMSALDPCYTDYSSIEEFIQTCLKCPSHPFGKALLDYCDYFNYTFLCGTTKDYTQKKALDKMVASVHQFVDALSEGIVKRYQYLDLNRWEWEVTHSVHNLVMSKLYRSILPIYLIYYQEKDNLIDAKCAALGQYKGRPELLGVQQRLCTVLSQKTSLDSDDESDEHENWFCAIKYLQELPCLTSVDDKLHHIVQAINILCTSVESFYYHHIKTAVTLSADDVLSLFVYAMIAAEVPCIYSQCRLMDHFIMDEAALGEEGYALATFDTALSAMLAIKT